MISYDFNTHSMNGEAVPYCALPFHALEAAFKHEQLTQTAKNAYIALLSYAAYKNKLTFGITVSWVAEKLAVTRKTAGAALAQLREFGFANDSGILIPKTEKKARVKAECFSNKENNTKSGFHSDKITDLSTENVDNNFVQTKYDRPTPANLVQTQHENQNTNNENELETMILTLVTTGLSRNKAESIARVRLERSKTEESTVEKITQSVSKKYPHNNIPKVTTQENLPREQEISAHSDKFAVTNCKTSGGFSSSNDKGGLSQICCNTKPQRLIAKIGTAIKSALGDKDVRNNKGYVTAALRRMTVRSQTEIDRYYAEIMYAIHANQMQTIKGCLWLIEQGKWKAPAGMY